MKRFFPHPLMFLSLLLMWVLLNQSLAPLDLISGAILALLATRIMSFLGVEAPKIRFARIPRLAFIVLYDIARSNMAVARITLSRRKPVSGFVRIQLDTRNRYCLAVLACVVTATPGTLWVAHDSRSNRLLLHVFDLVDEHYWIELIKGRYEQALMEIFE